MNVNNKQELLKAFPGTQFIYEKEGKFAVLGKNSEIPWIIIVPYGNVDEQVEIELFQQSLKLKNLIQPLFKGFIYNLAKIGNRNPVYHLHLVFRKSDDALWPEPIWCREDELQETKEHVQQITTVLENAFNLKEKNEL